MPVFDRDFRFLNNHYCDCDYYGYYSYCSGSCYSTYYIGGLCNYHQCLSGYLFKIGRIVERNNLELEMSLLFFLVTKCAI